MKITSSVGGKKFSNHDVFNSCGSLTIKAETEDQRYALAAIMRSALGWRCDKPQLKSLRDAIAAAAEVCKAEHAIDREAPAGTIASMSIQ